MAKGQHLQENRPTAIPLSVLVLWVFGGTAFALIVYLFTPYTHNLDDIKVTFQYVFGPIVWGFFAVALWTGHVRRIHPMVLLSVFAFALVYLASTVIAPAFPWRAWRDMGFQLTIMAPFIVVVGTCTNERRFRNMCLFYYLVGFGTVLFGIFHYFGGMGGLLYAVFPNGPPPGRSSPLYTLLYTLRQNGDMLSTILNRDFYPAYLLMIAPLGIAMMLHYRELWMKAFFILSFFLMCLCIVLAFSKDTYLALFIMAILFVFLYTAHRNWRAVPRRTLWLWGIGGLLVFATILVCIREKFYNLGYENYISVDSRRIIWGGAIGIFWDLTRPFVQFIKYIFLGGGGGAYYLMFPIYRDPNYHLVEISNVTLFAHNQYLDLLCEQGLLGLGSFLFFLIVITRMILREARRRPDHPLNVYQIVLATSVFGISFQNFFSPNIRWTVCGFNYWFLLGLVVAAAHMTLSKEDLQRIARFYDFSPRLRRTIAVSFLLFAVGFEAFSIPYGLTYFNAAKNNNDGLIILQSFTYVCEDLRNNPSDQKRRREARVLGQMTIEKFRNALAWQPSYITSHYKLAHVHSLMASPVEDDPATTLPIRRARQMEWWQKAEEAYNDLAFYAPDYSEIHLNYGILGGAFYLGSGNPKHLSTSLLEFHRAVEMSNKLNVQMLYFQRLRDAYETARRMDVTDAEGIRLLAETLGKITPDDERHARVREGLTRCRDLIDKGDYTNAAPLLADAYLELSIKVTDRMPTLTCIELHDDQIVADARRVSADYYFRRGRYAEAFPILEAMVDRKFDPAPRARAHNIERYAMAAVQEGEHNRSLKILGELIRRNPLNWIPREAARGVLMQVGEHARALVQAEALVRIVEQKYVENPDLNDPQKGTEIRLLVEGGLPSKAEAHYNVGEAAMRCGQLEYAYNTFNKVIELDPNGEWGKKAQRDILEIQRKIEAEETQKTPATSDQATTGPPSVQP